MAPKPNNEEIKNAFDDMEDKKEKSVCDEVKESQMKMVWEAPSAQGLYDPQNEHEACGVGFIVAIDGKRSNKVRNI